MALLFHLRFGVELSTLSVLFFGANLLAGLSFLAAVPLARHFGLLDTMVFTHLPSNVLLTLVAFAPAFPIAAGLLLLRQTLSQMDMPMRQAYTMVLVDPQERTAAAGVTSLARSVGSSISPMFSGLLLQGPLLVLGLPFILAGALKAAYDLTLWSMFRHVRLRGRKRLTPPGQESMSNRLCIHHRKMRRHPLSMAGGRTYELPPEYARRFHSEYGKYQRLQRRMMPA